jgi:LPXTG-site transpeptidase (sortase) family protein
MSSHTRGLRALTVAAILAAGLSGADLSSTALAPLVGRVQSASAVTYTRVSSIGPATRATRISIPRLKIAMPIRSGVLGGTISRSYAYHYPGTSWPGGGSNTYLYAHGQAGAFLNLKYARVGDQITLRLVTGRYVRYRVTIVRSVAWNDLRWLRPTTRERITLQTCLGNTKTARRLIVVAVPAY